MEAIRAPRRPAWPFRETEGMRDGSDAIGEWPILNGLVTRDD